MVNKSDSYDYSQSQQRLGPIEKYKVSVIFSNAKFQQVEKSSFRVCLKLIGWTALIYWFIYLFTTIYLQSNTLETADWSLFRFRDNKWTLLSSPTTISGARINFGWQFSALNHIFSTTNMTDSMLLSPISCLIPFKCFWWGDTQNTVTPL